MITTPSTSSEAITLAAVGNRALAAAGQSDMVWGHASVRDPGGRGVWMKGSGWGFEEICEDRVVLVSPKGDVLHGTGRRHIEYPIHTQIMARRADVGAVVHTHADAANAFAALDVPIRPLNHAGSLFSYPDVPRFTLTGGLISSAELGTALADALGSGAAFLTAVLLDKACRVQLDAMAAAPLRRWGQEEDTVAKRPVVWADSQLLAGFEYLARAAG